MRAKVLTLGLLCLLLLGSILSAEKKRQIDISWQELFPDHLERVYIIMKDGVIIQHSSQDEAMIDMSIGMLEKRLKERGSNIKEIAIIIHNHRMKKSFSRSDYKQYWMLKSYGFDGQFLMYCHRTKEVYPIEKEKSKKKEKRHDEDPKEKKIIMAGSSNSVRCFPLSQDLGPAKKEEVRKNGGNFRTSL
ncbi:hypothetical protein ES705_13251 [subsurface metagenome]